MTLLVIISLFIPAAAEEEAADFKYLAADNGLKVVLSQKDYLPLVNIVLAVNMGSKDETDETSGYSHILEHVMLFRGSQFKAGGTSLAGEIRRHGGYFNGHTDHDLATFEISLPAEHVDFGLETLKKVVFDLSLSQAELDKEKEIILEEISNIKDDPYEWGNNLVLQHVFGDHPYRRPVFGKAEVIRAATVERLRDFYSRYFFANNSALVVVGRISIPEVEKKIRQIFATLKSGKVQTSPVNAAGRLKKNREVEESMDIEKSHLVLGFFAPRYDHEDQLPLRVLTQIMGGGINPMLGGVLRGRRRLAEGISMRYIALKYGGAVVIHLTLDQKNIPQVRTGLLKFLKNATQIRYTVEEHLPAERRFAFEFLETARNQILYRSEEYGERGLNTAVSLARYLLLNEQPGKEGFVKRLQKIAARDLRRAASRYLAGKKYVMVTITPKRDDSK